MSPLTKAFVVLVTLLSILLVALVVPFVANTDDLRGRITELEGSLAASEAVARSKTAQVAQLQEGSSADVALLNKQISDQLGENARLIQTVTTLEAQVKEANSKVDKLGASSVLAQNSINQITALLDNRTAALTDAQATNVALRTENAQLIQRNNELDSQVTGLNRSVRLLREQLADVQGQLAGGGSAAAAHASASPATTAPSAEVLGQVTGVQPVDEGVTFIQLNIGANDQVAANTKLIIYRDGSQLVGTATIKSVDETVSVARVDSAQSNVRVGDAVVTGIRY